MKRVLSLSATLILGLSTPSSAENIELDWNAAEVGFTEKASDGGAIQHGVVVYVPGSRLATEEDFSIIVPGFCSSNLPNLLEFAAQIDDAPEISFLTLQIDFYGPKVGESEPYVARAATVGLEDGECSF